MSDAALGPCGKQLIEPLTKRELEVLGFMCDGLSNEEISTVMDVTLATVKWHLLNVYGKMGVKRRTQAVALAIYLELVRPNWLLGKAGAAVAPSPSPEPLSFWRQESLFSLASCRV